MSLRVAIADDAMLLRQGIEAVLTQGGCEVVASVGTADDLLAYIASDPHLDAVILDIRMPPGFSDEGIVALEKIRVTNPTLGVLLLSMYTTSAFAIRAMGSGAATGYLLKERVAHPDALVRAVKTVAAGGSVVDPEVVSLLVDGQSRSNGSSVATLTQRERDVLSLMAEGKSNRGIATALFLSLKTVETHIGNILGKLQIDTHPEDHRRVLAVLRSLGKRD